MRFSFTREEALSLMSSEFSRLNDLTYQLVSMFMTDHTLKVCKSEVRKLFNHWFAIGFIMVPKMYPDIYYDALAQKMVFKMDNFLEILNPAVSAILQSEELTSNPLPSMLYGFDVRESGDI